MPTSQTSLPTTRTNAVHADDHEQNDNWEWSPSFTEFIHTNITGRSLKVCPGLRPICDVNLDIKHLGDIADSDNAAFSLDHLPRNYSSDSRLSQIREALTDETDDSVVYGRITADNPENSELYDGYACQGDMFDLPFADNSFDTVVSDPPWLNLSGEERKELFDEVVRVTKPTGKILYNATWIPEDDYTRQFELRFRQQKDFWGGPSFAVFYRRTARDLSELFAAHDYESADRFPDDSVFWSETFHPNAVSEQHNTDPGKVSSHPKHRAKCCPACGASELHQVRDPAFESSTGTFDLYECGSCRFRVDTAEVEELAAALDQATTTQNCPVHELSDISYTPPCLEPLLDEGRSNSTVPNSVLNRDLPWVPETSTMPARSHHVTTQPVRSD